MSKNLYNESQINQLKMNPNILSVSERSISYHPNFKIKAVRGYQEGKSPTQIFIEQGFDPEVIGTKQPKRCLKRWRDTFEKYGKDGLLTNRRGIGSTGRSSSKSLSVEEKLRKAEA